MEPRKGAERRLAPRAKATSAALALVVLALIVSGCGGDSDPETAGTAGPPTTGQAAPSVPKPAGPAQAGRPKADASLPSSKAKGAAGGGRRGAAVPLPADESGLERGPTPQEEAEATLADMTLRSPALIGPEGTLPRKHTCDGEDRSPPLQWGGTPEGSEELILFAMSSQPVNGKLFFAWAVAGIDPGLSEIEAGRLPQGAIVGRNSFGEAGYSICPAPGTSETYVFALFALPEALSPSKGFDPAQVRREVLELSGNVGLLAARYGR